MRWQWRHRRAGELDHELIWLSVTVIGAAFSALWLALRLPWPVCTFRELTGHPCATCGATRAGLAFLHGHPGAAWHFNPLMSVLFGAIALFDLYALTVLVSGAPRMRVSQPSRAARKWILGAAGVVVLLNWLYLLRTY